MFSAETPPPPFRFLLRRRRRRFAFLPSLTLITTVRIVFVFVVVVQQLPLEQSAVLGYRVAREPVELRAERDGHQRLAVAAQRRRRVPVEMIRAVYPRREVLPANDDPLAVAGPREARRVVVHAAVRAKETERRELFEHRRRRPDLDELSDEDGEGFAARGELARGDFALEVHVVQRDAFSNVHEDRAPVRVERQHVMPRRRHRDASDLRQVLARQRRGRRQL
mmetsp:Transcript_6755/g.24923  ORF Transcript_6755/g.24923 Transcript_6755/m.24923 type:complete len:223 (-) Transcript_6755:200-868(-)